MASRRQAPPGAGIRHARCANCGRPAGPRFCPHCGQEVVPRRGPFLEVTREALSDWLSLDSRLLRSLRALTVPGKLSELYVGGRRAPFLRPFRLYLVASVVLFSTVLTLESPDATQYNVFIGGERVGAAVEGEVQRTIELLPATRLLGRWQLALAGDRVERFRSLPKQEVLDRLTSGFRRLLPAGLILFVPFLALGLKLLYVRGKAAHTLYLDHLVFALHYQTALFFALAGAWLVTRLAGGSLGVTLVAYVAVALVMPMVYLPLALYRFYRQSLRWTAVKTLILLFLYIQILGPIINFSALVTIWRS